MSNRWMSAGILAVLMPLAVCRGDAGDDVLKSKGLARVGYLYAPATEQEVVVKMRDLRKARSESEAETRKKKELDKDLKSKESECERLDAQVRQLSGKLESYRTDVEMYNRVVGQINSGQAQLNKGIKELKQKRKEVENFATDLNAKYMEILLELADKVAAAGVEYDKLAADPAVKAAIDQMPAAPTKPKFGHLPDFVTVAAEIKRLRGDTNAASIPLHKAGGVFYVEVSLNEKLTRVMILDTGASGISLPWDVAVALGMTPDETTRRVQMQVADGKIVPGYLMKLKTVRVGPMLVRDVQCIVSAEGQKDSPMLLGGTFLKNFEYSVDPAAGALRLARRDVAKPGTPAVAGGVAGLGGTGAAPAAGTPEALLKAKGLIKMGFFYVVPAEFEITEKMREYRKAQAQGQSEGRKRKDLEDSLAKIRAEVKKTEDRMLELERDLKGSHDTATNNRTVAQLRDLDARRRDMIRDAEKLYAQVQKVASDANSRSSDVLMELAAKAEAASAAYDAQAADAEVAAAVEKVNLTAVPKVKLGHVPEFVSIAAELKKLRGDMATAEIPLHRRSGVNEVEVTLNDILPLTMILDTGASYVSLPPSVARKIGLVPDASTKKIKLGLADGKIVEAYVMKIRTIRVGGMVAKDVTCCITPGEDGDVPMLLGGAFLKNFLYKVDPQSGVLRLTRRPPDGTKPAADDDTK